MSKEDITQLLDCLSADDPDTLNQVLPLVYEELRHIARNHMASERSGHTLSATALVHETYLNLTRQRNDKWQNRGHFFAVASIAMRRILVSHARSRACAKRGDGIAPVPLEEANEAAMLLSQMDIEEVLTVDQLLERLQIFDARAAKVVEHRYFGGLTNDETAEAMGISVPTVKRAWRLGKSWLAREVAEP